MTSPFSWKRLWNQACGLLAAKPALPNRTSKRLVRSLQVEAFEERWTPTVSTYLNYWTGELTVQGDASYDYVTLDHGYTSFGTGYTSIQHDGRTDYYWDQSITSISLQLGEGHNVPWVRGLANRPLHVQGGSNSDSLFVGTDYGYLDGILGSIHVRDQGGGNHIQFYGLNHINSFQVTIDTSRVTTTNPNGTTTVQDLGRITGLIPGGVTFDTVNTPNFSIFTGIGNDSFDIRRAPGMFRIEAGSGNDTLVTTTDVIGQAPRNVIFEGYLGSDTFILDDSSATDSRQYAAEVRSLTNELYVDVAGRYMAGIRRTETVTLRQGAGNDAVTLKSLLPNQTLYLYGGGGNNQLQGPDGGATFTITDPDTGNVANDYLGGGYTNFQNFGTLIGGNGFDNFRLTTRLTYTWFGAIPSSPQLSGSLDGGLGENTLDYSSYFGGDVTVNLALGTATKINGSVARFTHLYGGYGTNLLVGDAGFNTLSAPSGHQGRNILIGGGGEDWLFGGYGDDLLIGGSVTFDVNELNRLRDVWASSKSFAERMQEIKQGLTVGRPLDATTYHEDQVYNQIYGNGGQDWIFALDDNPWLSPELES